VDSSHINKNEKDKEMRIAIHKDQVAYERRKSNGDEVLGDLHVMEDEQQLSEKVICNNLLDHWWDVRFSPGKRPIYLAFAEVHELSGDIAHKGIAGSELTLETGVFKNLYRSVAVKPKQKWVCFFLHRNQAEMSEGKMSNLHRADHFFPVVFDYKTKRAHCFGVLSTPNPEVKVEAGPIKSWACWMGPQLWTIIGQEMGWGDDVGNTDAVTVISKSWPQVSRSMCRS
jgi:hypothetical protein